MKDIPAGSLNPLGRSRPSPLKGGQFRFTYCVLSKWVRIVSPLGEMSHQCGAEGFTQKRRAPIYEQDSLLAVKTFIYDPIIHYIYYQMSG